MSDRIDSNVGYLLAGLTIGWLIGIFFAPKSGEETRDYLSKKINRGHRHARKKARELRERAEDLIQRGKEIVDL
jgi:gas vesicle protein